MNNKQTRCQFRQAIIGVVDDAKQCNDSSEPLTAHQLDESITRTTVECHRVRGILARRDGRWRVDNEDEVRTLLALGGADYSLWLGTLADDKHSENWLDALGDTEYVVDSLRALADTLQEGLINVAGVARLNELLDTLAHTPDVAQLRVEARMRPALAYACACLGRWKAAEWLEHILLARHPLLDGMPEAFWDRLTSRGGDPLLRLVALAADPRTGPETLGMLARSSVPAVAKLATSHPNAPPGSARVHD